MDPNKAELLIGLWAVNPDKLPQGSIAETNLTTHGSTAKLKKVQKIVHSFSINLNADGFSGFYGKQTTKDTFVV